MLRFQSRRHRCLMDESEQALLDAVHGTHKRDARIAREIIGDAKSYRLWESRHADLVLPVAQHSGRAGQIFKLRDVELKLLHRRALVRSIRRQKILGKKRDKLFSVFYGPKDTRDAILAEHRQYTLAVSSRVSTDHLIDVMQDPVSVRLLREYKAVYSKYFALYCATVTCEDASLADATRLELSVLRRQAMQMIRQIHSERPEGGHSSFDRQVLLSRSGRYEIRDYMVV